MSTRGQSIAADVQLLSHGAPPRLRWLAAGAAHILARIVTAIAAIFATIGRARGETPAGPVFVAPGEMRSGALLLESEGDRYVEAPRVGIDIDLTVSGPTARARVTQVFRNPTDGRVEVDYVHPLPAGGAVDILPVCHASRACPACVARTEPGQARAAGS